MAVEPLFGLELGQLRHVRAKDLLIRFAFGATISIVAGLGGNTFGSVVGGLLLAFPAILPATLTLLEHQEGNAAAVHDLGGAIFGGVGLVAFAVVAAAALGNLPTWAALVLALAAWAGVSLVLYLLRATEWLPLPGSIQGHRTGGAR